MNKEGMVVVVRNGESSWSLPKGRIEKGEDIIEVAKLERGCIERVANIPQAGI